VSLDSLLGKAYLALAGSLAGQEMPLAPPKFSAFKNLFSSKKTPGIDIVIYRIAKRRTRCLKNERSAGK